MKFISWLKKFFNICEHEWEEYTPYLRYSVKWKILTCKKCGEKKLIIGG